MYFCLLLRNTSSSGVSLVPSGPHVILAPGGGTEASNGIGREPDRGRRLPVPHKAPQGDGSGHEICFIDFVHWVLVR